MAPSKSILIVDDDIELGALLAKALSTMSDEFTVKIARDVDEAMVQLRRAQNAGQAFDLLITDIKMSGLSGLELLEALRSIAPQTKTIAMTAYNSPDIAGRADALGVYAYLTKPFVLSEFHQAVRQTLDAPLHTLRRALPDDLSPRQRAAVVRALGSLRTMTGADAALVVRRDGVVVAVDVLGPPKPVDELGAELESALRAIAEQMTRAFDQDVPVQQSYFGTEAHSVCTYRIDQTYTAAVAFGPDVRQGQVWYYLREAASTLEGALDGQAPPLPPRREPPTEDVFDLLRRFFPEIGGPTEAQDSSPTLPADDGGATDQGAHGPESFPLPSTPPAPVPEADHQPAEPETPSAKPDFDALDWDIEGEEDWSTPVDSTDASRGLTLDEARRRGLIGDLDEK
jgi:CheY-like chemotaxis protein/predicted regulator of Ras-like GTPase activity (Roadblock/LC7/MglB family)